MIKEGYGDRRTIERRIAAMESWIENPKLLEADKGAKHLETIEIDMNK